MERATTLCFFSSRTKFFPDKCTIARSRSSMVNATCPINNGITSNSKAYKDAFGQLSRPAISMLFLEKKSPLKSLENEAFDSSRRSIESSGNRDDTKRSSRYPWYESDTKFFMMC